MGYMRTDSTRRYQCAHFICDYLSLPKKIRAVVTSRDIALFHHISLKILPVDQRHAQFSVHKLYTGIPFWILHPGNISFQEM